MGLIRSLWYSFREMFKRPKTIMYPYEKRDIAPRVRNILTLDRETCVHCGLCAKMCPNDVLTMVDGFPQADLRKCSFCFVCVDACPKGSLRNTHIQEHGLVRSRMEDFRMELPGPDGTVPKNGSEGGNRGEVV